MSYQADRIKGEAMQECIFFDAEQMMRENRVVVAPMGMKSKDEIFSFYSSALSFPDYFGWNWDAFDECIHDISWLGGATLHIVHPDIPLANNLDERAILLSSLHEIKLYSRTNGRLAIHFKAFDKQEVQKAIVRYYEGRGYCGAKSSWKWLKGGKRRDEDPEMVLLNIDKEMAISYVKMGFLDESEQKAGER